MFFLNKNKMSGHREVTAIRNIAATKRDCPIRKINFEWFSALTSTTYLLNENDRAIQRACLRFQF